MTYAVDFVPSKDILRILLKGFPNVFHYFLDAASGSMTLGIQSTVFGETRDGNA